MQLLKNWLDALQIDFVGKRHIAGMASLLLVVLSWVVFVAIGPNWGIDFTGGTELHLKFTESVPIQEVRGALTELGLSDDAVQAVGAGEEGEFVVRIQRADFGMEELATDVRQRIEAELGSDWIERMDQSAEVGARFVITYRGDPVQPAEVAAALEGLDGVTVQRAKEDNQVIVLAPGLARRIQEEIASAMGDRSFEVLSIDAVGPKVGGDLRRQGFISIAATLGLVLLYVAFRFDIGFAPGAILALFHDVSLTIGAFVLMQLEFNLPMIGALLTIVGYSLNDTIVIYDRIRENRDRYRRTNLKDLLNVSINETLTRTVATSLTTILAVTSLMVLGGPVIRNFAFAMFLGIIFGTYSTVFVASPMILLMEDIKPFLSRLVAAPAARPADDGEDAVAPGPMTESEKRRRERAHREHRPTRP